MPLIIMAGLPSSGKSTRTTQIVNYFLYERCKSVIVVSENTLVADLKLSRNQYWHDAVKEKQIRAQMKSDVQRSLKPDCIVVLDAGNYIKGYRYELYCLAKSLKSTYCIVGCESTPERCWEMNVNRPVEEQYSKEIFDSLVTRQEPPNCWNRWDRPLITVQLDDDLPGDQVYIALYNKKPPKSNLSTQSVPLSSTNYLYEMDCVIREISDAIEKKKKQCGCFGDNMKLAGFDNCVIIDESPSPAQLAEYRKQFLSLNRMKPLAASRNEIAVAFINFINSNMHRHLPGLFKLS